MVSLTCPACAAAVKPDDLICFTCGANLPRRQPDEDPPPAATVMQEYLRREEATGSISTPALRPALPTRTVEAPAGTPHPPAPAPAASPLAPPFSAFQN